MYQYTWHLSLMIFSTMIFPVNAQTNPIPNQDFEVWSNGQPENWFGLYITQSADSYSGSYAVHGQVDSDSFPVIIWTKSGTMDGFVVNDQYSFFAGYYRFQPVGNDRFRTNIAMWRNGQPAALAFTFLEPSANYQQFMLPISYATTAAPDCCIVTFQIWGDENNPNQPNAGTQFYIDNLSLGFVDALLDEDPGLPEKISLSQNYPNPFNPSTTFEFSLPHSMPIKLLVYNTLGQEVAIIVNEQLAAGNYTISWHAEGLPGGIYFYRLHGENFSATRKLVLLK